MIETKKVDPSDAAVQALIWELDEYQESLYPAESNHLDSLAELKKSHVFVIGAFSETVLVGIGAVKNQGDYGEIKRMYVSPKFRGKRVGDAILDALEDQLLDAGIRTARLETGIHQPDAIRFYEKHGYRQRSPFGTYKPDPQSLFFEKQL